MPTLCIHQRHSRENIRGYHHPVRKCDAVSKTKYTMPTYSILFCGLQLLMQVYNGVEAQGEGHSREATVIVPRSITGQMLNLRLITDRIKQPKIISRNDGTATSSFVIETTSALTTPSTASTTSSSSTSSSTESSSTFTSTSSTTETTSTTETSTSQMTETTRPAQSTARADTSVEITTSTADFVTTQTITNTETTTGSISTQPNSTSSGSLPTSPGLTSSAANLTLPDITSFGATLTTPGLTTSGALPTSPVLTTSGALPTSPGLTSSGALPTSTAQKRFGPLPTSPGLTSSGSLLTTQGLTSSGALPTSQIPMSSSAIPDASTAVVDYTDDCACSPCQNNAVCRDGFFNYTCDCWYGFSGRNCENIDENNDLFYPYGPQQNDRYVPVDVDGTGKATLYNKLNGLAFFHAKFDHITIHTNGYVTFQNDLDSSSPQRFPLIFRGARAALHNEEGFGMIAPLWTDSNAESSNVTYHIYTQTSPVDDPVEFARSNYILALAKNDLRSQGLLHFEPTLVAVVTWEGMRPKKEYGPVEFEEINSYQLVLISDGLYGRTYALFYYKMTDWRTFNPLRDAQIGYYVTYSYTTHAYNHPFIDTTNVFRFSSLTGNRGETGRWLFALYTDELSVEEPSQLCLNWFFYESLSTDIIRWLFLLSRREPCPCDETAAVMDFRWKWEAGYYSCYYDNRPRAVVYQACCYENGALVSSIMDGRAGPAYKYHPDRQPLNHQSYDRTPLINCCVKSSFCLLYYLLRPPDDCSSYIPPITTWALGDPHIVTLDGLSYTFNGLGEYWLVKSSNTSFGIQGRTAQVLGMDNTPRQATVFVSYALQDDNGGLVEVTADLTRQQLQIFLQHADFTDTFLALENGSFYANEVTFNKMSNNSLAILLYNDAVISFTFTSLGLLDAVVFLPESLDSLVSGLFGNMNEDPTDDLETPQGTTLPSNVTDRALFQMFGNAWRINETQSFFTYQPGRTYDDFNVVDFEPIYMDELDPVLVENASVVCGGASNMQCIYDAIVTGNDDFGRATKSVSTANEIISAEFDNTRPVLVGNAAWNVTAGKLNNYTFYTTDADGDAINVTLTTHLSSDLYELSHENNTGIITLQLTDVIEFNISLVAFDSRGGYSPILEVVVNLCNCSIYGACNFDQLRIGQSSSSAFRLVMCTCDIGYEGSYCESETDGCDTDSNPCLSDGAPIDSSTCVDLSPADQRRIGRPYNCTSCALGYEYDVTDAACSDMDECLTQWVTHNCSQSCINTLGSFYCDCYSGYELDATNIGDCQDVDECVLGIDACQQLCINTNGSYVCDCVTGFILDTADNATCVAAVTPSACLTYNCSYACYEPSVGQAACLCPSGYLVAADNTTCEDSDECETSENQCVPQRACENYAGGYNCLCPSGFILAADQRFCQECERGTWGPGCVNICNCKSGDTVCNVTSGCEECISGWTGGSCDENIDECLQDPCDNHSTCIDYQGTFACDCDFGYEGITETTCVEIDECSTNPCLNLATCNDFLGYFNCTCRAGYMGTLCQTNINECASSPCQNGASCVDAENYFRCACVFGYVGDLCEIEMQIETSPLAISPTAQASAEYTTASPAVTTDSTLAAGVSTVTGGVGYRLIAAVLVIVNRTFDEALYNASSAEYSALLEEFTNSMTPVLVAAISADYYVSISNVTFSPGSIYVDYVVTLLETSPINSSLVLYTAIMTEAMANDFFINTLQINISTVQFDLVGGGFDDVTTATLIDNTTETAAAVSEFSNWAVGVVVVGAVVAVIFVTVITLSGVHIISSRRVRDRARVLRSKSRDESFHIPRVRRRHWQPSAYMTQLTNQSLASSGAPSSLLPRPYVDWSVLMGYPSLSLPSLPDIRVHREAPPYQRRTASSRNWYWIRET